jgi:hypothetical protein
MTMPHRRAENRPQEVEISFWLWISAIALGVLGSVLSYRQIQEAQDQAIRQVLAERPGADPATVERYMTVGISAGIVIGLLFLILETVFVFLMRGGRNWARIGAIVSMYRPAANTYFRPRQLGF